MIPISEGIHLANKTNARIESELEVKTYIQDLKFALNNGAQINFQAKRRVDENRRKIYKSVYNKYIISK